MKLTRRFPILLTLSLFVAFLLSASPYGREQRPVKTNEDSKAIVISSDNCETKREACNKSCLNQRATCDKNNPNNSAYCIGQQNTCDNGCNNAWKKCSENP